MPVNWQYWDSSEFCNYYISGLFQYMVLLKGRYGDEGG